MNVAVDLEIGLLELRLPGNFQLRSLGHRVDGEVSGALLVESKIVEMNRRIERWLLHGTGALGGKVRAAGHCDASVLQDRNTGQIKIRAGQREMKCLARRIESGISCDLGFVVGQRMSLSSASSPLKFRFELKVSTGSP